jgi:HAMP domain-containing protein
MITCRRIKRISLWLWRHLRLVNRQTWTASVCFAIVFARFIWPQLAFDTLSLYLVLIAAGCVLIPDVANLIARIRRIKIGNNEIELGEAIDRITSQTEEVERRMSTSTDYEVQRPVELPRHIERYIRDPRGGLIAVAADIESQVRTLLVEANLSGVHLYISPLRGIELLAAKGLIDQELPMLMRDFWVVRNKAVHDSQERMTDDEIYRLVDLGVRILDLLTIRRKKS